MNALILLGQSAPWTSKWLTPIWLLGLGAVGGLAILLAAWGALAIAARIPGLSALLKRPAVRRGSIAVGTAVLLVGYLWFVSTQVGASSAGGAANNNFNAWVGWLLLTPFCWLAPYALLAFLDRRAVDEIPLAVREGVLAPIGWVALVIAACSLLWFVVIGSPGEYLHSLRRLPYAGQHVVTAEIPPAGSPEGAAKNADPDELAPLTPVAVSFRRDEIRRLTFRSTENLHLYLVRPASDESSENDRMEIGTEGETYWLARPDAVAKLFPEPLVSQIFVRNLGSKPARLTVTQLILPSIPEVASVPITALAVVAVFLAYLLQRTLMPRVSAVALATFKSETAQPLFPIITIVGCGLLFLFVVIPYNTFGEDIKMLKDAGVKLIMVLSIIQAVWGASTSIAEEVEGRTALTVLSKPIGRRSFIIGKFLGIAWTVALMFIVFGALFLAIVAFKPIYDFREGGADDPTWQICNLEMLSVFPGLLLAFMETIVLTAISVAISTRLPMLANFVICFSIYVLGNLTPMIVKSSIGQFEIVQFVGQLIATIVPNLESFDIQAAVASGQLVPTFYLGWAFIYCLLYTLIALLTALVLFEDRDLA